MAKVRDGVVQHVWPNTITKKGGRVVTVDVPAHVKSFAAKGLPLPEHFVEVPDEVQINWIWDEGLQAFTKRVKHIPKPIVPHSDLLEVVAEKLNLPYAELWDEVMRRKRERKLKEREAKAQAKLKK